MDCSEKSRLMCSVCGRQSGIQHQLSCSKCHSVPRHTLPVLHLAMILAHFRQLSTILVSDN